MLQIQRLLKHWIYKILLLLCLSFYGLHYTYNSIFEAQRFEPLFILNSTLTAVHVKGRQVYSSGLHRDRILPFHRINYSSASYSSLQPPDKNTNFSSYLPLCPEHVSNLSAESSNKVKLITNVSLSFKELQDKFANSSLEEDGRYRPSNCSSRYTVAIIVPYRNRFEHLSTFLLNIHPFLQNQNLDYTIFIVEQAGEDAFNRAMLFNVGFTEAMKIRHFDCFIFHDVDLLPEDNRNLYTCPEQPRHMSVAVDIFDYKLPYKDIFGGVCAIPTEQFQLINGFSNTFWGWGAEDDDIAYRLKIHDLKISRYPSDVARYTMLKHEKQRANPHRYEKLFIGRKMHKVDGLNNLEYERLAVLPSKLFTWIYVQLYTLLTD